MTQWKVPLSDVTIGIEELEAVTEVLKSGWLSMGPMTQHFEEEFAIFLGIKHAFAVTNGTAALHLACGALGLKTGDEVLCPALTFVASANAILYSGARPVFIDIHGPHDLNISLNDAASKITERTKAIMVVHYGGYPCEMDNILLLSERNGLKIIEDCAHAPGTIYHFNNGPKKAGTLGGVGCFSFFSNKNMTTGEGGMVVTNDDDLASKIKTSRSHGMTTLTWDRHKGHSFSYDVKSLGYNYRLDEMRAALGLVQLSKLLKSNAQRQEITRLYREKFMDNSALTLPFISELETSACHLFPVVLPLGTDRSSFMMALADRGIQTSIHYPPIHLFSHYRTLWPLGFDHSLPHTEEVAARLVTLPLFPNMTETQLDLVVDAVLASSK